MKLNYKEYFKTSATNNQFAAFQDDDEDDIENHPILDNVDEMSTGTLLYNNQPDKEDDMSSLVEVLIDILQNTTENHDF
jgi:hypothetical protein